eukprot:1647122-Prymnesium_polylepis.1
MVCTCVAGLRASIPYCPPTRGPRQKLIARRDPTSSAHPAQSFLGSAPPICASICGALAGRHCLPSFVWRRSGPPPAEFGTFQEAAQVFGRVGWQAQT